MCKTSFSPKTPATKSQSHGPPWVGVRLGHLLLRAAEALNPGRRLHKDGLGNGEEWLFLGAVPVVEQLGNPPAQLHVQQVVFAHRDVSALQSRAYEI